MSDKVDLFNHRAADIIETRDIACEVKIGEYFKEADSIRLNFLKDGRVIRELQYAEQERPIFKQCLLFQKRWEKVLRSSVIQRRDEFHTILAPDGTDSVDIYCLAATKSGGGIYRDEERWIARPGIYTEYVVPQKLELMHAPQKLLDEMGPLQGRSGNGDIDYIDSVINVRTRSLQSLLQKSITLYYPENQMAAIIEEAAVETALKPLLQGGTPLSNKNMAIKCTLPQEQLVFYATPEGIYASPGTRLNAEQTKAFRDLQTCLIEQEVPSIMSQLKFFVQERLSDSLNKAHQR